MVGQRYLDLKGYIPQRKLIGSVLKIRIGLMNGRLLANFSHQLLMNNIWFMGKIVFGTNLYAQSICKQLYKLVMKRMPVLFY